MLLLQLIAFLRPNAKEKAKQETCLNENVVISGNIAQLPGECNLWNVSEQAWFEKKKRKMQFDKSNMNMNESFEY